jgi:hypothetical protein
VVTEPQLDLVVVPLIITTHMTLALLEMQRMQHSTSSVLPHKLVSRVVLTA